MSNKTITEAPFYDLGLGLPLWVIIVWAAVGFLLISMIVIMLYVCRTRKRYASNESCNVEEGEIMRQRSLTMIDTYPHSYIEELHTVKQSSSEIFPPPFGSEMKIPRATEVKMVEPEDERVNEHENTANDNSGLTLDELTISITNYDMSFEEDYEYHDHPPQRKINISREASFRASNISEENKAKQRLREKMLVNELREKIRRERRTFDEHKKY